MARLLSLLLATALLLGLFVSPTAFGAGVGRHRALAAPDPPARTNSLGGPLIASEAACPGQEDPGASVEAQQQTMRCLTDFAREQVGLGTLTDSPQLDLSAAEKSADVLQCDSFSHEACGREFTYWMRQAGYLSSSCWHVGENLAWGTGEYGTVRSIFRAWMRSPEHRHNILGSFDELGLSLVSGELEGNPEAQVWTEHFGSHCATQQ